MKKKLLSAALAAAVMLSMIPGALAAETANPTNDKLTVNGVVQNPTVYKIGGSNYFKIRDVAAVLNGTDKQFSVGYSGGKVTVTTGQPYEATGKELSGPPAAAGEASPSNDVILVNGEEASLTVYKIGGSNYFKLRDLGGALDFRVDWEAGRGVFIETGGESAQPEQPVTPALKDVEVTAKTTDYGTGYYVADNGFGTGKLNNGKAITEANVLEMLEQARKIWPDGTSWAYSGTRNNHWYEWSGSVVDGLLINKYGQSPNYACGGLTAMLSDYVFGLDSNPFRRVYDPMNIKAGDIIVIKNADGTVKHVTFAATSTIRSGDWTGRIWTTDGGGTNGTISWPNYQYSFPTSEAFQSQFNPGLTWEVWSRYPA